MSYIGKDVAPQPQGTYSQSEIDTQMLTKVPKVTSTDNAVVRFDGTSGQVQNSSVVINDSGNLGIGTSSPYSKLHISGTNPTLTISPLLNSETSEITFKNADLSVSKGFIQYSYADDSFRIRTNGSERMRIDSSGNVGIGVTPSAWRSNFKALDISNIGSLNGIDGNAFRLQYNSYMNGSSQWIYNQSLGASLYEQYNGTHSWLTAPSGTAGSAITWNTAMTLESNGNLKFNSGYGSVATAYGCRAWVKFVGSNGSINGSANVSSVTYNSTGSWWINFSNSMPDVNYSAVGSASGDSYNIGIYNQDASRVNMASAVPSQYMVNPYWVDIAVFR